MELLLYRNTSEQNRVNKTNYLELITTLTGTLKQATSIVNPIITIDINYANFDELNVDVVDDDNDEIVDDEDNDVVIQYVNTLFNCNYAFIPQLNRYYFITDIVAVSNRLWELHMHVDVLMSFKDQLANVNAFVSRNEFTFNKDLIDDEIQIQNDVSVQYVTIENDLFDTLDDSSITYYVLNVVTGVS